MKFILKAINRRKRKRLKINRASLSYQKANHFGILYTYIDENKQKAINDFADNLRKDGKRVDLLPAITKQNADNRYFKTFKIDEVNSFGTWSNNNVNLFIYQQYDFMIYPDLKLNTEPIPSVLFPLALTLFMNIVSYHHSFKKLFSCTILFVFRIDQI